MVDFNSDFGQRALQRLQNERIIWLVTVREDGTPQPTPVWFIFDGERFLIFSRPEGQKLRNIARNPRVALHLDGNGMGGDIVVLWGEAALDPNGPDQSELQAYLHKYTEGMRRIGMTPEEFANSYNATMRVQPTYLGGH